MSGENKIEEKLPPQNIEAEMSVLGSMLIEENALSVSIETLNPHSFYKQSHNRIFQAMTNLFNSHKPVDVVTLVDELRNMNQLDEVGGASYIASLSMCVPTAANVSHYIKIVKDKEVLRNLITMGTNIAAQSYLDNASSDILLESAQKKIYEISMRQVENRIVSIKDIVRDTIEIIDNLYQKKGYLTGLSTGYDELDKITSGLQKSDLIILAGRPSMGKSALMCCIAENVVIKEKIPTVIFSLEMSKQSLVQRMLCSHARVNAQNVRTGFLSNTDWPKLTSAAGKLSQAPLYIDDTPGLSITELRAKARRMKSQYNIGMIVIDYLQLVRSSSNIENRQQEISDISRSLKAIAREVDAPVLAVSQLSRAPERRDDNRPKLSDLRESGAIEQDADVVFMLFREEYYKPEDDSIKGQTEVIIAKQRNGPVGTVKLAFVKEYTKFENLSYRTPDIDASKQKSAVSAEDYS